MSIIQEQTRLAMLQVLQGQGLEGLNSDILFGILEENQFPGTEQQLRGELNWLAQCGLVELNSLLAGAIIIAKLTTEGEEVCKRKRIVPGVAAPKFKPMKLKGV
jgi:hypothetical protein